MKQFLIGAFTSEEVEDLYVEAKSYIITFLFEFDNVEVIEIHPIYIMTFHSMYLEKNSVNKKTEEIFYNIDDGLDILTDNYVL